MTTRHMNWIDLTALVLVIVGALNWGLVGAFRFDLVRYLFGVGAVTTTIYVLVGLAGLYAVWTAVKAGQEASSARGVVRERPTMR